MKSAGKIALALAALALVWWLLIATRSGNPQAGRAGRLTGASATNLASTRLTNGPVGLPPHSGEKREALIGETILRGYATSASTPENDLKVMAQLMENYTLLVKASAQRPMSANEDWAAAFRGLNPARERFLPDDHPALNARHQLVDRWQTPLFFHALGGHRFDLRSAGPDKKMWTADDLHRNADGSFRRGGQLNPASLFDDPIRPADR